MDLVEIFAVSDFFSPLAEILITMTKVINKLKYIINLNIDFIAQFYFNRCQ